MNVKEKINFGKIVNSEGKVTVIKMLSYFLIIVGCLGCIDAIIMPDYYYLISTIIMVLLGIVGLCNIKKNYPRKFALIISFILVVLAITRIIMLLVVFRVYALIISLCGMLSGFFNIVYYGYYFNTLKKFLYKKWFKILFNTKLEFQEDKVILISTNESKEYGVRLIQRVIMSEEDFFFGDDKKAECLNTILDGKISDMIFKENKIPFEGKIGDVEVKAYHEDKDLIEIELKLESIVANYTYINENTKI